MRLSNNDRPKSIPPNELKSRLPDDSAMTTDDFRGEFDMLKVSEEEAQEILAALYHIMHIFVDIGWGVDTIQIVLPELFSGTINREIKKQLSNDNCELETPDRFASEKSSPKQKLFQATTKISSTQQH